MRILSIALLPLCTLWPTIGAAQTVSPSPVTYQAGKPMTMGAIPEAKESMRGVVRAINESWLSTELSARILQITKREGESFETGDILIAFDCDKYAAELQAARAEEEYNAIVLENSVELDKRNAIGKFEVAQNRTRLDKAKAQTRSIEVRMRECRLTAPFPGKVAELKARHYEISPPNQPLIRISESVNLEIEIIVPSLWLRKITPGMTFNVKVDETETLHTAKVQRIAATVESASQTVKIMAIFTEQVPAVLPGMSLSAEF